MQVVCPSSWSSQTVCGSISDILIVLNVSALKQIKKERKKGRYYMYAVYSETGSVVCNVGVTDQQ
jgi:hypothetical protein